jgi:preprotein translocase subunit SecG
MQTVVLVVHLILALALTLVVLLQRSEGGGLGMGSGGGVTGRAAPTPLGRVTWWVAGAFIATSIALTIIAAENAGSGSVVDRIQDVPAATTPDLGGEGSLLPPPAGGAGGGTSEPLVPTDDAPLVPVE